MSPDSSVNRLLHLLGDPARAGLFPVAIHLHARDVLFEPGMPALYVYFPITAVISLVSTMEDGASAEVAVVGREGMVGLASVLGGVESATAAVVQIGGTAWRASAALLKNERVRLPAVRAVLDLYTEARLIQVAQTAACNRLHSVEARLARWLLALADRIDADQFRLPQEFMAQMLGVHRPTVSLTLQGFRKAGAITYHGRSIAVVDRGRLEQIACECYGVLRREFDRLLRPSPEGFGAMPMSTGPPASGAVESPAALETMREIAGRLLLANIREQEARAQAEAANRTKDQFLAMVSHELRTPLNAIVGWCFILTERPDELPERGLRVIQRNAQALLKLVEELLDAARLTSDTLSIHPSVVSLGDVVGSAVEAVKPAADVKGVALRVSVSATVTSMLADPDRLRQIFLNVLANALKFTEKDGAIDVSVTAGADQACVSVRDTGCGIAADVLPHVFERFRQGADATAVHHGLGLGLTIARVLVELHGGTIRIASSGYGQGTTCTIELPIAISA